MRRLLDLQSEDSAIKRLDERRAALPEAQRLAEVRESLSELDADLAIARKQEEGIGRDHARLEGEVELLEGKIAREEGRLFSGGVSSPKELSALQAEVEMLKRKKSTLEDQLLEVMEHREQAAATVARLETEHATATATAARLEAEVAHLTQEIDAELAARRAARAEIAPDVPDDLIATYEKIRDSKGGVGAAALVGNTCSGCHTSLPSRELERMRAEGGLQRCENCRRILVV